MAGESIPLIVVRLRGAWGALDRIDPRADPSLLLCVEATRYAILVAAQWSAGEGSMEWRHSLAQDAIETALALERAAAALIEKGPGAAEIFDSAMQLGNALGERLAREGTLPLVAFYLMSLREAPPGRANAALRKLLAEMKLDPSDENLSAWNHVLTRPPARGDLPHWRVVAAGSDVDAFFARWLSTSTRRQADDFEEQAKWKRPLEDEGMAETIPARGPLPGQGFEMVEVAAALFARAGLTPRERETFEAAIAGESMANFARRAGIASSTARVTLRNARKKLRKARSA